MAPRQKISTFDLFSNTIDGAMDQKEAFSPEAVENFYDFLIEGQFVLDRRIMEPDKFYWLLPLYKITRTDIFGVRDPDTKKWIKRPKFKAGIIFRKASQMGASSWSILFMLWLCIDYSRPLAIGCYWPNEGELQSFVQTRLNPMLEASSRIQSYMEDSKVDSTQAKQIGASTLYFRHSSGKSANDAVPLDIIIADEVRLWDKAKETVQRIKERYGQSDVQLLVLMSTVGSKGDYMEVQWGESKQLKYFSHCESNNCHTSIGEDVDNANQMFQESHLSLAPKDRPLVRGVVLSDYLPNQIVRQEDGVDACYRCPCCGEEISDPRDGGYIETRPNSEKMYALEFARTLSPALSPYQLLTEYKEASDVKQFMNGYMGKPWVDPEGRPVREEHWKAAQDPDLVWEDYGMGGRNFLGADFRAREMHYVVGQLGDTDNKGRLLTVGVYRGSDWQPVLEQLIQNFAVEKAVIDYVPFTNETLKIADRYEGRVFLAQYRAGAMLRTQPAESTKATRKVSSDGREKHMVFMDQVKMLTWSLGTFARGNWKVPASPLYQSDYVDRLKNKHDVFDVSSGLEGVGREGFKHHLMGLALVNYTDITKNQSRENVTVSGSKDATSEYVDASGFDPHWAHAFNYMVAAAMLEGGGMRMMTTINTNATYGTNKPPIPADLMATYKSPNTMRVCGTCVFGPQEGEGECQKLGWTVEATAPECGIRAYRPRQS